MIAQRTLAILSAALLVGAVALATLGPRAVTLEVLLLQWGGSTDGLHAWLDRMLGPWAWGYVMLPLLIRPAWLVPAGAGIVFSGLALSLSYRKNPSRSSHRRS